MVMVRRDIKAEGYDSTDYFLAVMPQSLPSTYLGMILEEKLMPLKEKIVAAFIPPYDFIVEAFFQVLFEDGTKKDWFYAWKEIKSSISPDDSFWKGTGIPNEFRPQNREKEEEVLLQIINDLHAKGYHAQEESLSQFFDRKTDKLFLELSEGGKQQENTIKLLDS